MDLPNLKHDYYNAVVSKASWGPRREVALTLGLWPVRDSKRVPSYRFQDADPVRIRFGGIRNYEEVMRFFKEERHEKNGLHFLRFHDKSRPGNLVIEMQWDASGVELRIHCSDVTVSERGEAV